MKIEVMDNKSGVPIDYSVDVDKCGDEAGLGAAEILLYPVKILAH